MLAALYATPPEVTTRLHWRPAVKIGPASFAPHGPGFWLVRPPRRHSPSVLDVGALVPAPDVDPVPMHLAYTPSWHERAVCRQCPDADTVFFSDDDARTGLPRQVLELARSYCAQCPVARQCIEWSLRTPERAGVWGGTTWYQRSRLLRRIEAGEPVENLVDECLDALSR